MQISEVKTESKAPLVKDDKAIKAVHDIVDYNTLPPQIDFKTPFKNMALAAEAYLESLPPEIFQYYFDLVNSQTEQYFNSEAYYIDSLF